MNRIPTSSWVAAGALAILLAGLSACGGADSRDTHAAGSDPESTGEVSGKSKLPPSAPAAPADAKRSYQEAPDFRLADLDGGSLTLSELRGKVVLLDFWATWCGPCRRGIPHLNTLWKDHHEDGLEIVGISVDRGRQGVSGADLVRQFAEKTPMVYRLVMADASTAQAYGGIRSIPTAFLIDREGRIRKRYVGLQQGQVFERDIKELLGEAAPVADEEESI